MASIGDLLRAYAEGRRKEAFGPNYQQEGELASSRAALARGQVADMPLRTQALEQSVEQGGLNIEQLREAIEQQRRTREVLQRMEASGALPEGFSVSPQAATYADQGEDRAIARETAGLQRDVTGRQFENMPTPEEAEAARAVERRADAARASYWEGGGRGASQRYTGRPLDEDVMAAARMEALQDFVQMKGGRVEGLTENAYVEDGTIYGDRVDYARDPKYQLSLEDRAILHQLMVERLLKAGWSEDALLKAGLSIPAGDDDCDPEGLGLGCE